MTPEDEQFLGLVLDHQMLSPDLAPEHLQMAQCHCMEQPWSARLSCTGGGLLVPDLSGLAVL